MRTLWSLLPVLSLVGCSMLFGSKSDDDDDDDDDDDVVDTGDITGGEGGGGEGGGGEGGGSGGGGGTDADGDGYTTSQGDCDDDNGAINPEATDVVGDDIDQNCDGVDGTDADGDGWASDWSGGTDCNDDDPCLNNDDADSDGVTSCEGDGDEDCVDGDTWPVADAGPDQVVCEDVSVQVDGSDSWDPDGVIVDYEWRFGSTRESGSRITLPWTPDEGQRHTWELTVTDDDGKQSSDELTIHGNENPLWDWPTASGDCSTEDRDTVVMDDHCFGNSSCVCTVTFSATDADSTPTISPAFRYSSACSSSWSASISGSSLTLRHTSFSSSWCQLDVTYADECVERVVEFAVRSAPAR